MERSVFEEERELLPHNGNRLSACSLCLSMEADPVDIVGYLELVQPLAREVEFLGVKTELALVCDDLGLLPRTYK